jgi:hypothetical protein
VATVSVVVVPAASPAWAASLNIAPSSTVNPIGDPVHVRATGTADRDSVLDLYYEFKVTRDCADTARHERDRTGAVLFGQPQPASGAFNLEESFNPYPGAGKYLLCGYLYPNTDGADTLAPSAAAQSNVTVGTGTPVGPGSTPGTPSSAAQKRYRAAIKKCNKKKNRKQRSKCKAKAKRLLKK